MRDDPGGRSFIDTNILVYAMEPDPSPSQEGSCQGHCGTGSEFARWGNQLSNRAGVFERSTAQVSPSHDSDGSTVLPRTGADATLCRLPGRGTLPRGLVHRG